MIDQAPRSHTDWLEPRVERIYRCMPVGISLIDTGFRFLHVNETLAAINGLPVEAHLGRTVQEVVPEIADRMIARFRRVLETGEPVENAELTATLPSCPGEARTWLVSDAPIRNAGGEITAFLSVVRDITELRRREEREEMVRARLADAERVARLGCWEWDLMSDEVWWSEEQYRIFGRDPETFRPSFDAFVEHVVPEDRPLIREQLDAIYAGRTTAEVEYRASTADGRELVLVGRGTLRRAKDGEPRLLFGTTQDVTEVRLAQQEMTRERQRLERERDELARQLEDRTRELDRALDRLRRRRRPAQKP